MGYIYEIVTYNRNLPGKIILVNSGNKLTKNLHWHKEIELVYVVRGILQIQKEFKEI